MIDRKRLYAEIGERVKEARDGKGVTQKTLAGELGLTRTSITNIELGNQKLLLHTFVELCLALGKSPSDLLGDPTSYAVAADEGIDALLNGRSVEEQAWIRATLDSPNAEK